jgi:hypothetical protein
MIEIRYTDPEGFDISGTGRELQAIRQGIFDLLSSEKETFIIEAATGYDPAPYDEVFSRMVIRKGAGPTKASIFSEKELLVEGRTECLSAFASFFNFEPGDREGLHTHHEYFEGNDWIAPDSIPLVIGIQKQSN